MKSEAPIVGARIDAVLVLAVGHLKIQATTHRVREVFLGDETQQYLLRFERILREFELCREAVEVCNRPIVIPSELRFRAFYSRQVFIQEAQFQPAQTEGEVVCEEGT